MWEPVLLASSVDEMPTPSGDGRLIRPSGCQKVDLRYERDPFSWVTETRMRRLNPRHKHVDGRPENNGTRDCLELHLHRPLGSRVYPMARAYPQYCN